jgi:SWI/SNF-related matrix-associated actin-dependent regulator of chromatin subfamily A member 5
VQQENTIAATLREAKANETPEDLEKERLAEQEFIDTGTSRLLSEEYILTFLIAVPLTEEETEIKTKAMEQGFESWSRRDYQQFIKGVERVGKYVLRFVDMAMINWASGTTWRALRLILRTRLWRRPRLMPRCSGNAGRSWTVRWVVYVPMIVANTVLDYARIKERFEEGAAKRDERAKQTSLLSAKIAAVRYPMQELQINYGNVKQKIYSEEEDRYILCRLAYYGIGSEDLYEKIKRDITEFPQFRFDWFFKSRTSQELHRRGQQLLALLAKEDSKEEDDFGDEVPKARKVRCSISMLLPLDSHYL